MLIYNLYKLLINKNNENNKNTKEKEKNKKIMAIKKAKLNLKFCFFYYSIT